MSHLWYALQVRPRFEKHVEMHLQEKGYEAFLPTYISTRRWSDRVKTLSLPLFPSYVFCRFDIHARLPVLITPGVHSVVGIGKTPIPVEETEIGAIRHLLEKGVTSQPWPYLKEGEMVQVEEGPLEGLTGIVVRAKGADRLVVSVTLLMRSVSVEIDRRCVRPIDASLNSKKPEVAIDIPNFHRGIEIAAGLSAPA